VIARAYLSLGDESAKDRAKRIARKKRRSYVGGAQKLCAKVD
jgi:hypothetical protein